MSSLELLFFVVVTAISSNVYQGLAVRVNEVCQSSSLLLLIVAAFCLFSSGGWTILGTDLSEGAVPITDLDFNEMVRL